MPTTERKLLFSFAVVGAAPSPNAHLSAPRNLSFIYSPEHAPATKSLQIQALKCCF